MNITHVTPGLLQIPPNGWGAIEKIIWEFHQNCLNLGHNSKILYLNEVKNLPDQIIHIYVGNLGVMAKEKNMKYFFTMNDHHAYLHGKESYVFKSNLAAMYGSVKSFVSAKFLEKYFNYLPSYMCLGVNSDFFTPDFSRNTSEHRLLCVANNGYAHDQSTDRKGFIPAIEMARALDLPITIAGPSNNKKFLERYKPDYSKLSMVYDLSEEQLKNTYKEHTIFLHMSELEAGHPNMTILEAMSSGLPVVGTLEEDNKLNGMIVVKNAKEGVFGVKQIIENYSKYASEARSTAESLNWLDRTKLMLKEYEKYSSFKNSLESHYKETVKTNFAKRQPKNSFLFSYNNGPKIEILGNVNEKYKVNFVDTNQNSVVYSSEISNNHWSMASLKYYKKWRLEVCEQNGKLICSDTLNLKDKKVKIIIDSSSLGDVLAWVPYTVEFAKKHDCEVHCFTSNKELFAEQSKVKFFDLNVDSGQNYHASYKIGYFLKDESYHNIPKKTNLISLQEVAAEILGLDFKEIRPELKINNATRKIKNKYVCIGTQSTSQCKYWNNKQGWNSVVKYLQEKGYEVICIDKHSNFGGKGVYNKTPQNVTDKTGNLPLQDRITDLVNCEFFIGLGSGLSWLAWALNKPVILISGFSKPMAEFYTPYRVFNEKVCNGCWNDENLKFDPSNWLWCPREKNFECTKEISFEMVKEKIDLLIQVLRCTNI